MKDYVDLEARVLHLECTSGALQYELDQIRPQAMKYVAAVHELGECKIEIDKLLKVQIEKQAVKK